MRTFKIINSDLSNRMDVGFYSPEKLTFFNEIKNKENLVPLKDIILEGSYGVLPEGNSYNIANPITLIRATDMLKDFNIDFKSKIKVPIEYYKHERARLRKYDVLLAVKGATIASAKSVAFVEEDIEDTIINGSIFRFQVKDEINPKYIAYMLSTKLLKKQMKYNLIANNAVDYLSKDVIESLLIPLPNKCVQDKIVEVLNEKYSERKKKLKEANYTYELINSYILDELGICEDIAEEKSCFSVSSRYMIGNRMDTNYYNEKYLLFEKNLKNSKYKIDKLANVIISISNGLDYRNFTDEGTLYLKVANIKPYKIITEGSAKIDLSVSNIAKDIKIKNGDLLLTRKGTYGNCVYIDGDKDYIISSEVFLIRVGNNMNGRYLEAILNSMIGKIQYEQVKIGAIMGSLSQEALKGINIPVPPKDIQNKIATNVKMFINKVENLKYESIVDIDKLIDELFKEM